MTYETLKEIKKFANKNYDLDENNPSRITVDGDGVAVANPWLDCSGRFPLTDTEAVEEWGLVTIMDFCEKAMEIIKPKDELEFLN